MTACFLENLGGDFTCTIGRDPKTGKLFLCERCPGTVELRYRGVKGAIYVLPGETFLKGRTGWKEEVVSPVPVTPLEEIPVKDAAEYLPWVGKGRKTSYPALSGKDREHS